LRLVVAVGWLSLLSGAGALAVERGGLAGAWLERLLSARLGSLGGFLSIEDVEVRWLEPGLDLRGFVLHDREELIRLEHVHAELAFSLRRGLVLARLEVEQGHVLIGKALMNGARGLLDVRAETGPAARGGEAGLPTIQLRGLDLSLEGPDGVEALPLGRLDLSLTRDDEGLPVVMGRVALPRSERATVASAVYLRGRGTGDGWIDLHASARELDLETIAIPPVAFLDPVRDLAPRGRVSVDGHGRVSVGGVEPAEGSLRLALRRGSVLPPTGDRRIEAIELDFDALFSPGADEALWSPGAWTASASFSGRWSVHTIAGGARLGREARPGFLFEVWARLPDLPFDERTLDLLGRPQWLQRPWRALDPDGRVDVTLGLRCQDSWQPPADPTPSLEYLAGVRTAGTARATWRGWPRRDGKQPIAFPLPASIERGRVVFAHTSRIPRPDFVAVVVEGAHTGGPFDVSYCAWSPPVDMPPFAPGFGQHEEDLSVRSPNVLIDDELQKAMEGLAPLRGLAEAWQAYRPRGGRAGVELRLVRRNERPHMAAHVRAGFSGVSAAWREVPVPGSDVSGELEYVDDGVGDAAVRYSLRGSARTAAGFELRGRARRERPRVTTGTDPAMLEVIRLDVDGIALTGPDRDIVAESIAGVGAALDAFGPSGHADLRFESVRHDAAGGRRFDAEVVPVGDVVLVPPAFPMEGRDVAGRVLVRGLEPPRAPDGARAGETRVETVVVPLAGTWRGGVRVAVDASFPSEGAARLAVTGAGLAPSNADLRAELLEAARAGAGVQEGPSLDLDGTSLTGAVDFRADVTLPEDGGPADSTYVLHLRGNSLVGAEEFRLDRLDGPLVVREGRLHGDRTTAVLGRTPVVLTDVELTAPAGGGYRLEADVSARDVPLDRDHLRYFIDGQTLDVLLGDFRWRGRIDVHGAHISWHGSHGGAPQLALSGDVTLSDVFLQPGVPFSIRSSSARIESLVFEGGGVRGWGTLDDLYGQILGRELGPSRMLVTYFDSHLSLDRFDGTFARGRVKGLERDGPGESTGQRPGPAFSVELEPPYPFDLALDLEGIDLGLFLRDLSASNIANKGALSCGIRLNGNLRDLLSVRGSGRGEMRETRLWSLPVFRDLFGELGFDDTAVFDRMSADFRVEDGLVYMENIEVHSPLLILIGRGTLDMDGALRHDLQIRYSLVDKIKPLTRIFYLLQNTLLSVSIRGDMSRPVVILRGALTALFSNVDDYYRNIPLPGMSPLPARF